MFVLDFRKERQQEIISAIKEGSAIPAPKGGWSRHEMLQVAGAMYAAIWDQGPVKTDLKRFEKVPRTYRDATEETLVQEIHDAIEFFGELSFMIDFKEYDAQCEPHVQVVIDGKDITVLKGRKQKP